MDDVLVLTTRHSCKVCGKGFPCGRSLGGHMRSHADEETYSDVDDEVLSSCWFGHARGGGGDDDDIVMPVSDAAVMAAPRRRRRSMRVPAPASDDHAFDKEPEDVARCLIMLSRDTAGGMWGACRDDDEYYSPKKKKKRDGFYHDDDADSGDDDDEISALLQYADVDGEMITKSRKRKSTTSSGEKRGRYECPGCGRAFQSYQALGGHRASHKRINSNCCTAKQSFEMNVSCSTSPDRTAVKAKKAIKFQCPICFKVFGSGQALGGHKRSHSIAVETEIAAGFLDLNLPAPGTED